MDQSSRIHDEGYRGKGKDTLVSNRSFDKYLSFLGISLDNLGQKVLDLGSGTNELFSREASKYDIEVVSLNPALINPGMAEAARKTTTSGLESQGRSVAGIIEHLPFKDYSFDSVVSVVAIPFYLKQDPSVLSESFQEIVRVLKNDGKAFMSPIPRKDKDLAETVLRDNDISYILNLIPRDNEDVYGSSQVPDMFRLIITKNIKRT